MQVGDKVIRNDKYWEELPEGLREDTVQTVLEINERYSWPVTISCDDVLSDGTELVSFDEVDIVE